MQELLTQIDAKPVNKTPEITGQLASEWEPLLGSSAADLDVRLTQALLDRPAGVHGLFYGVVGGRTTGPFDVVYLPDELEPVAVGKVIEGTGDADHPSHFQLWTGFRPRRLLPEIPARSTMDQFEIRSTIHPDLSMRCTTKFQLTEQTASMRVVTLEISNRMRVLSASIDDKPAEVFQHQTPRGSDDTQTSSFLIVAPEPIAPGRPHLVTVEHEGAVIEQTSTGAYFVQARNAWFPHRDGDFASSI